jgi:hypothetical protein
LRECCGGVPVVDQPQQLGQFRRALQLRVERLWSPEEFVGVADHARPAELADAIDHLGRLAAAQCEVASMQDALNAAPLEVGGHRVERGEVAMDVGDDRQAHADMTVPTRSTAETTRGATTAVLDG